MALHDYVAEEIALDCREGLITRREALRRLGLLGLGAAAGVSLLAACGGDDGDDAAPGTSTTTSTTAPRAAGQAAEAVRFPGPRGQLQGAWANAATPAGAVLLIHENRGLTDHFRSLPRRLAGDGYSAMAVDLLSEEGGTAAVGGEGEAQAALGRAPTERVVADLRAGIDELARRSPGEKLAVMGFCFGGGLTWQLLAVGEQRLAAAVPFYGTPPDNADFSRSKAAVLAIYAEQDSRVNATRDRAVAALQAAGLVHEVRTFPGADHAFFNDTSPRYNPAAAAGAYQAVLNWFRRHLA
jgi:carboxymethylenebutenolidase